MGQASTKSKCMECYDINESPQEIKDAVYSHYPGLEQQLDMAYACHDLNNTQLLPYSTLEPILRHLFLQYGLIEYITRFSNELGILDSKFIQSDLKKFNVQVSGGCSEKQLRCHEFKSVAVVWIKKILDTYTDDQAEWLENIRESQEEQSQNYTNALKAFESKFVLQQSLYKQSIEDQNQQVEDWNKILEDAERSQEEVYSAEMKRMNEIKYREENALKIAMDEKQRILHEYTDKISDLAKHDKSAICFTYPSSCTPYGACISAGAQEPIRRPKKMNRPPNSLKHALFSPQKKTLGCC